MFLVLLASFWINSWHQTDPGIHANNYKHPQKAQLAPKGYFKSQREIRQEQRHYKQMNESAVVTTTDAVQPPEVSRRKANYKQIF